jgi:hypothetical protein
MKAIELTEEHKDKLLEMCDALFPKYDDIRISKDLLWLFDNKNDDFEVFHWFEFCMTHLAIRFKKLGIDINYWLMTLPSAHSQWPKEYNHPLDYLYFEFKKLKL